MKKVRHWLHIVLMILTSGLWAPVYVILLATTEMFNRGYREGKAAGRREIAADPEWMRVSEVTASGPYVVEPGSRTVHIVAAGGSGGSGGVIDPAGNLVMGGGAGSYADEQGRRVIYDGVRFGCTTAPIAADDNITATAAVVEINDYMQRAMSRIDRFAELCDRKRNHPIGLTPLEQCEYEQLRRELSQ